VNTVLYVQNDTHRAGAQTCLARLLAEEKIRQWRPVVLSSAPGWFTEECTRLGIPHLIIPFPRSRSIGARLFSNEAFTSEVLRELDRRAIRPTIVHANDHWEGILAIKLASALKAHSAMFLRTPMLTERQYFKYRCSEFDLIAAVGEELRTAAQSWDDDSKIELIPDGISRGEFGPPKQRPALPPKRVLAIGAKRAVKGWADLIEALGILERDGRMHPLTVDFTGRMPSRLENDLKLEKLNVTQCNFIGRIDGFRDLVLGYDLVINPSRSESFGMAAVEVLAAGVPLLTSETGVLGEVMSKDYMRFPPMRPGALASAIHNVLSRWEDLDFGVAEAQEKIMANFLVEHAAEKVDRHYRLLTGGAPTGNGRALAG
jgi:glycosyltransferase involved in cell wall biosynthesis